MAQIIIEKSKYDDLIKIKEDSQKYIEAESKKLEAKYKFELENFKETHRTYMVFIIFMALVEFILLINFYLW